MNETDIIISYILEVVKTNQRRDEKKLGGSIKQVSDSANRRDVNASVVVNKKALLKNVCS